MKLACQFYVFQDEKYFVEGNMAQCLDFVGHRELSFVFGYRYGIALNPSRGQNDILQS